MAKYHTDPEGLKHKIEGKKVTTTLPDGSKV